MATNKQALLRYKTIDQCLQNRLRTWTLNDLIEAVSEALFDYEGKDTGIGKRTIQQDIQVMRSDTLGYNAPIIVVNKRYYTYEDKKYTIATAQMSNSDISKLQNILEVLKQMSSLGYFNEMSEMITKLENSLARNFSGMQNLVQFETNTLLKGLEFINPLYQVIKQQKAINICYKSFKAINATENIYYPYLLKEYRNRWFLIAHQKGKRQLFTLALDRIDSFTINNTEPFVPEKQIDFDHYYDDVIGVTKTERDIATDVLFKAVPAHAPYIITKPLHSSQQVLQVDENGTLFKIKVIINFELERELLGFGDYIKVIAPRLLVRMIKKRVAATQAIYDGKSN